MNAPLVIAAAIGAATTLVFLLRILVNIHHYFLSSFSYSAYRGKWAVITGASAGIGAGFAKALAKRGVNVALLARSTDKLEEVAQVCSQSGVQTAVIPFDFASPTETDWTALADRLKPLSPSILVNNVGVNVEFPTEFVDMSAEDVSRIVSVNVNSTNAMTAMLLPSMLSEGRGIILCLSSGGGVISPAPLLAPYGGTKAYNDAFAVALHGEVRSKNVLVHSLTPFFVESAMAKMRASFTVPSADRFAEDALRLVGSSPRLQPYWVHYIMQSVLQMLPLAKQVAYVTDLHRNIRKRALRKKERVAKQN